jgi:hypothetical protein
MTFKIKKGKHYCDQFLYKLLNLFNFNKKIEYIVKFDSSCIYELNKEDQLDINKLFGFSSGFSHHQNSVRFGWNYIEGKIVLYAYCYDDGKRIKSYICRVDVVDEIKLTIFVENDAYVFEVQKLKLGSRSKVKMYKTKKFLFGYNLWPYFGGNNVAPHEMSIQMTKVN